VEEIAPVNHHIHFPGKARSQSPLVICKKIVSSTASFHPWSGRQVESQMGIGQEEYADGSGRYGH
jgi:hypothetical protein